MFVRVWRKIARKFNPVELVHIVRVFITRVSVYELVLPINTKKFTGVLVNSLRTSVYVSKCAFVYTRISYHKSFGEDDGLWVVWGVLVDYFG